MKKMVHEPTMKKVELLNRAVELNREAGEAIEKLKEIEEKLWQLKAEDGGVVAQDITKITLWIERRIKEEFGYIFEED